MRAEQNKINKRDQRDPREQQDWGRLLMNEERRQARKLSKVGGGGAGVAVAPGGAVFGCAGACAEGEEQEVAQVEVGREKARKCEFLL
jgi:hypothetical protein